MNRDHPPVFLRFMTTKTKVSFLVEMTKAQTSSPLGVIFPGGDRTWHRRQSVAGASLPPGPQNQTHVMTSFPHQHTRWEPGDRTARDGCRYGGCAQRQSSLFQGVDKPFWHF